MNQKAIFHIFMMILMSLLAGCSSSSLSDTPSPTPACTASSGAVEEFDLLFDTSGTIPVNIYLPPCYDETETDYPTLYLLHGGGLNADSWIDIGAGEKADGLIAAGEIAPLIIVSPNVESFADEYRLFFMRELVPYVEANYRSAESPTQRALGGMSLGGGMTTLIGFTNPDDFISLGILAVAPIRAAEGSFEVWADNLLDGDPPAILLDVGLSDSLIGQHDQLAEILTERGIAFEETKREGGHTLSYWARYMEDYLVWFDQHWNE